MKSKKISIHTSDIEVLNKSWSEEDRKSFSEFLKENKKSIYSTNSKITENPKNLLLKCKKF